MTSATIANLITGEQIERLHHFLDNGFKGLTKEDERLLDRVVENYTRAAHEKKPIYVRQTDRIKITESLYYADFKNNITTQKRTLKCVL
jgi:hypothetical protein